MKTRVLMATVGAVTAALAAGVKWRGWKRSLSAVTSRFPDARLDSEPVYKPNVTLRGLSTLAVEV